MLNCKNQFLNYYKIDSNLQSINIFFHKVLTRISFFFHTNIYFIEIAMGYMNMRYIKCSENNNNKILQIERVQCKRMVDRSS